MSALDAARDRDRGPRFKLEVAHALGLKVRVAREGRGGSFECPACGAVTRHTKSGDRRLAVGVAPDGRARCFQCDRGFDAIGIAAWRLDGGRVGPATLAFLRDDLRLDATVRPSPRPATPPPAPPPRYPDREDVLALWNACGPLDDRALAFLESDRGFDVERVQELDIVRQLPRRLVEAAPWSHGWARSGHSLVFPLVDARGEIRSVLARLARPTRDGDKSKSLAVPGFDRGGLVVACPSARAMLASACHPPTWTGPEPMCVVITEGEIDVLAWATTEEDVHATIGIFVGSMSASRAEHARRIAWGARVLVALDLDEASDGLRDNVRGALRAAKRTDLRASRWIGKVAA
jgi:hypothetical protein